MDFAQQQLADCKISSKQLEIDLCQLELAAILVDGQRNEVDKYNELCALFLNDLEIKRNVRLGNRHKKQHEMLFSHVETQPSSFH